MATIQHDLRAASAVTVRALPLVALLFAVGCNTPQAAVPVQTEFDDHADGFEASDGWVNGEQNGCGWRRQNASIEDGTLTLAIDDRRSRGRNFSCGEYRTTEHHGFGYYETRARVQPADGTVTAFFTYTGEPFGDPHDEIDFEWLGRDTTQVQLNYFVDGQGRHERMIDLGFDAAADFHVYGFEWRPDRVSWYVDCKLVHEVTSADGPLPRAAGRIYIHLWNGARSVRGWLGEFAYDGEPVRSTFDYLRHIPGGTHESSSSCAGGGTHDAALEATAPAGEPIEAPEATPMIPRDEPAMTEPAPSPEDRSARPDGAEDADRTDADLQPEASTLPVEASPTVPATSGPTLSQAEEGATSPNDGEPIPLGAFGADRP